MYFGSMRYLYTQPFGPEQSWSVTTTPIWNSAGVGTDGFEGGSGVRVVAAGGAVLLALIIAIDTPIPVATTAKMASAAITRRTFEVHGGRATAANAPEGGFVVTLELPLTA